MLSPHASNSSEALSSAVQFDSLRFSADIGQPTTSQKATSLNSKYQHSLELQLQLGQSELENFNGNWSSAFASEIPTLTRQVPLRHQGSKASKNQRRSIDELIGLEQSEALQIGNDPADSLTNQNGSGANSVTSANFATGEKKDWTVMVYMAGNDLEKFALQDFRQMAKIGSDQNVNIVVQLDRTAGYSGAMGNWTGTKRGLVKAGDLPDRKWGKNIGEANMGNADTLKDFVNWGMNQYQADNYAVVLWGHGDGNSVAYDDITNNGINAKELNNAVRTLPDTIDLIGTDACLMGNIKFAQKISHAASVYVGSQANEPGYGWNYTTVLGDLKANFTMNAAQLGTAIVDRYAEQSNQKQVGYETLSAIDLALLNFNSANNLPAALEQLKATITNLATAEDSQKLQAHQNSAWKSIGSTGYYEDLGSLLGCIASDESISSDIRTAAQNALAIYDLAVIQNYSYTGEGTGLSNEVRPF